MNHPRRLLVLSCYPERAAATRFRAHAYFPYWRDAGIHAELDSFVNDDFLRVFYNQGGASRKGLGLALASLRRLATAWRGRRFDAVFVQRSAALLGPPLLELFLARSIGLPLLFDFDDAIWLDVHQRSQHPLAARLLKNPGKTNTLIRSATRVVAGSNYLAEHALALNPATTTVRTVVSRERWCPLPGRLDGEFASSSRAPMLGWIGTHTTARQLDQVIPALQELARRGHRFRLRLVGARRGLPINGIDVESVDWKQAKEVEEFQRIDIGLAPMFDDDWSRGKCGFKQIQYMAVGVPMVTSPGGGAREFVLHQRNALIANSTADWISHLELLLREQPLRARLARSGRDLVEQKFCLEVTGPQMQSLVHAMIDEHATARRHNRP